MSAKIEGSLHLSRAQWRILASMMQQHLDSSEDDSVRGIARIVQSVAKSMQSEPVKTRRERRNDHAVELCAGCECTEVEVGLLYEQFDGSRMCRACAQERGGRG